MQIQIFTIQAIENKEEILKMNSFLCSHKIIDIEKQFVNNGNDSFWSFCTRYINSDKQTSSGYQKEKVDYKEILDEKSFAVFSKLREIRKEIAKAES